MCVAHLVQQRWRSPCSGSTISSAEQQMTTPTPRPSSQFQVAHRLWQAASDVKEEIQNLRNKFFQERIQSADLQILLNGNTSLHGFPDTRPLNMSFTERLAEDFRRVSLVAVFIEEMKRDEERSMMSPSYVTDYTSLESNIYPFLCRLEVAIRSQSVSVSVEYVGRGAMLQSDRDVRSTARRYSRDYKILNYSSVLFESIQRDYEFLHNIRDVITLIKRNKACCDT